MPISNGRPHFFLIDATHRQHCMSYESWPGDHRRISVDAAWPNVGLDDPTLETVAHAGLRVLI